MEDITTELAKATLAVKQAISVINKAIEELPNYSKHLYSSRSDMHKQSSNPFKHITPPHQSCFLMHLNFYPRYITYNPNIILLICSDFREKWNNI